MYLAEQISLGREVVLKVLDSNVKRTAETTERFLNEGRIIASLNHPHIITIYDIGQTDDKVYITMEFVEGGDLKTLLQQRILAPFEAIDLVAKIASGLAVAHEQGIVHRDVKPGNIVFRNNGTPLLSDFGIAKRLSVDSDLTSTGMFVGSPNYMAPEQSEAGPIDGRADIYALGVMLYEMLSGKRAYVADSVIDVIFKHKTAPIPTLPSGLEQFQELLDLMMAKDRNKRFRDAPSLLHYIDQMHRRGTVKSRAQINEDPDFDVSGEHADDPPPPPAITRVHLGPGAPSMYKLAMGVTLIVCVIGWGGLLVVERRLQDAGVPAHVGVAIPEAIITVPPVADSGRAAMESSSDSRVEEALLWLGRHSLDDFRLTAPPRDNAYYYFSRLLQLDPHNANARQGILDIAARYAMLADREIARDNFDRARGYVGIGLQLDPANESLRVLKDLSEPMDAGFFDALASLFK